MKPQPILQRLLFAVALLASQGYSQRGGGGGRNRGGNGGGGGGGGGDGDGDGGGGGDGGQNQGNADELLLLEANVQTASQADGADGGFTPSET